MKLQTEYSELKEKRRFANVQVFAGDFTDDSLRDSNPDLRTVM